MRHYFNNNFNTILLFVVVVCLNGISSSFSFGPTVTVVRQQRRVVVVVQSSSSPTTTRTTAMLRATSLKNNDDNDDCHHDVTTTSTTTSTTTRREFYDVATSKMLATSIIFLSGLFSNNNGVFTSPKPAFAAADDESAPLLPSPPDRRPFCVIGANGKTGTKCVEGCLERNIPVIATSRSGIYYDGINNTNPLLSNMVCDVTKPDTIETAVKGTRAVIFAASASASKENSPTDVDYIGVVNVAKACIQEKIPHLVIVSSGGVSKPNSSVYQFLNIFGGIMDAKIKGEDTVRDMYKEYTAPTEGGLTYTVIRPGGLTQDPARGVSAIELNQGDIKTGRISRKDVANLCIECTFYPKLTGFTTFECYDYDTGKTLNNVGFSNILKLTTDPTTELSTGKEHRNCNTYEQLFTGLQSDYV